MLRLRIRPRIELLPVPDDVDSDRTGVSGATILFERAAVVVGGDEEDEVDRPIVVMNPVIMCLCCCLLV